ncbi:MULTISPECIES: septum formation initiator family protein [unclassified Diaminobutyricimonas]|uniref:FtsB family cell division protein n=1 Tax=unclassified Diaminobutyricimonas TaxID=2643261 RepID=UPI0012F4FF99|nr:MULTISPECIES: septum formation initiator family protein [unclassified Diaminobutyricimonas]
MVKRQKTTQVPVALPQMETAPGSWLRGIRLSGFTVSVLFLLVAAIVVLAPSLRVLIEQQQQISALRDAVAEQEKSVEDLEQEVARWGDPAYLEAQARERLYYVYPGEVSYLVIDDGQTPVAADGLPISDEIQTTEVDWLSAMLGSIVTAGLTELPPDQLQAPDIQGSAQ